MEMRLCLAWKLIKLCIIALILTVPGSEGFSASLSPAPSVLPVEQVPHYIQDAAPPIGPVLAQASTPATPLKPSDASVPPLLAVPQHASAPAPLVVSPHESNPPPSASSPPNLPVLTHAPTQSSSLVSPSGSPAPPTSAPTSPIVPQSTPLIQPAVVPKHASSPLLMTMPPSASTLPTSPEIPEASPPFLPVMPRHAFAPPSPVLQTHAPNPLPRVIPSSALPTPPSAAPPRASAPRPLAVPRDASSQAPPPGPPLAMPPHASHLPTPTLLPTASPPPFALVPPHATAPSVPPVMPTHALAQPPQMVPHDTSSRAPPPLVTPPHTSTLSAPSLLPNASPPPFALVPPHATEPPLPPATPKHALAQPPQVVPQGASSRAPKPVAVLPFVSALPPPSLLPNASPPPFSLVPPHATAPPVPPVTPTHALAQPPQVVPHSTSRAPQPFAMSPSVSTLPPPSLLPNASPPPFALLPPRATKPPVPPVTPKHALAQPPQVAPHDASSRAPKPAAVPPSVSTLPAPSLLPSASPPPSALMPPHAASLPPPLAPHTPVLPHASALPPSMVIHNASSLAPPSLAVPPHASTLPAPSLLPNVSPPPSAPVPPRAASPSAPVVPQTPVLPHTSALAPSVITHNASSQAPPSSVIPPHSSTLPAPSVLPNVSPPSLTQVPPHAFAPPPHLLPSHGLVPQAPVLPRASAPTLPVVSQNTSALVPPPFEVPSILPNLSPPPSPLVPPPATAHRSPANPTHAVTPPSPAVPQHAFAAPTPAELPDISAPPPPLLPGNVLPAPPDASQRDNSSAPEVPTSPGSFPYIAPPNPKSKTPSDIAPAPLPTVEHSPNNGSHNHPDKALSPATAPSVHKSTQKPNFASAPIVFSPESSPSEGPHSASASPISVNSHRYPREKANSPAPSLVLVPPSASNLVPPPASSQQGQVESPHPSYAPKSSPDSPESDRPLPSPNPGTTMSKASSPAPLAVAYVSPAPPPSPRASSDNSNIPVPSPKISPSASATRALKRPRAPPIQALPPPPPNDDCAYLTCSEPLTNTPPGTPCGCVYPMQVALRLSVELYTFFPLVSELAREIATGVFLKGSQVRIMGANAATQEPEKTIVLVDLVPLGAKFDNVTAYLIYERFWHKQVSIDRSLYGDYDILYVHYLGLPPSPPMAPSDIAVIDGIPYATDPNGSKIHPLGVEVPLRRHRHRLSGSIIAVIVFSAVVGLLICFSVVWLLVARHTRLVRQPELPPNAGPSLTRSSGPGDHSTGSGPSSATLSFQSSLAPYTGSAKTFSAGEIEKATDNFNPSRILGEGGFGCVYSGVLEDETLLAVKVLKRDDQQGGREFLAEVEMLSRLHHRNLVKLIGICVDDRVRCLVYELIPNGSVESHLHGLDKERAPLDWVARMKIALGAARGLAYLHEDSSPRVIHRDFKASNILLEHDFTPKVSDFGLARTAMDEENRHISTRVMGTFGYVAPEYAMTGHLLVKSDVYSYGVVLLELLTGRKPVDMSQPPGQENLVTWARPFLTNRAGLVSIIDPSLGPDISFDNVLKVAAIASMCVQPEVSHRPFMGEVVQALKLVCAEGNVSRDGNSSSRSHVDLSDLDVKVSPAPEKVDSSKMQYSPNGCVSGLDIEKGLSVSDIFSNGSTGFRREVSGSFRRHSASGPIKTRFWKKMRRSFQGSTSEHGISYGLWPGSH